MRNTFVRQHFFRRGRSNIAVQHDEIREHPRLQLALFLFLKLGKGRTGRVSRNSLIHGQLLLRKIFLLAVLTLPRDRAIDPPKRRNRFNRIIRAKRQRHSVSQKSAHAYEVAARFAPSRSSAQRMSVSKWLGCMDAITFSSLKPRDLLRA